MRNEIANLQLTRAQIEITWIALALIAACAAVGVEANVLVDGAGIAERFDEETAATLGERNVRGLERRFDDRRERPGGDEIDLVDRDALGRLTVNRAGGEAVLRIVRFE
jgi:hypothetical protein